MSNKLKLIFFTVQEDQEVRLWTGGLPSQAAAGGLQGRKKEGGLQLPGVGRPVGLGRGAKLSYFKHCGTQLKS